MTTTQVQETQTYAIDPAHTTIEFVARHLMITKVRGHFNKFSGTLKLTSGSDLPEAINVEVDVNSVDTREPQRDAHLRSADFFDAEHFPTMTFVSKRVEQSPFRVYGDLTIRGNTREVALQAEFEGKGADPWGGTRVAYSATGLVNRKEFGLLWHQALETGGVVVGDEIRIELNVEAVLQK